MGHGQSLQAFYGVNLGIVYLFIGFFTVPAVARLLSSRVPLLFGFTSYPLYLIHQNMIMDRGIELYKFNEHLPELAYPIIPMAAVICFAYAITQVEPMVRDLLKKRFAKLGIDKYLAPAN